METILIKGYSLLVDDKNIYLNDCIYVEDVGELFVGIPIMKFFENITESVVVLQRYHDLYAINEKLIKLLDTDFMEASDIVETQYDEILEMNGLVTKLIGEG